MKPYRRLLLGNWIPGAAVAVMAAGDPGAAMPSASMRPRAISYRGANHQQSAADTD